MAVFAASCDALVQVHTQDIAERGEVPHERFMTKLEEVYAVGQCGLEQNSGLATLLERILLAHFKETHLRIHR